MKISIYKHIRQNKSSEYIELDQFLNDIQVGRWEDICHKVRNISDPELRKAEKAKAPYVTVSGLFTGTRNKNELTQHSGYLSIDIDKLGEQLEEVRSVLASDKYVYSCFTSISGTGLCAIFKINAEKHEESFDGIGAYLLSKYQIVVDPSGRDVCRPRYVSYDPYLTINAKAVTFREYLPKQKKREQISRIFVQNEFDALIDRMVIARVNCCEDYRDWRNIGFALADKFGEGGRNYFHQLSSISAKYDSQTVDKQYTISLQRNWTGGITIATLYWHANQANVPLFTPKIEQAIKSSTAMKKAGLGKDAISKNLSSIAGIDNVDEVIDQVLNSSEDAEENDIESIAIYIRSKYNLKRNEISRKLELDGMPQEDDDLNTIFLATKKAFPKLSFEMFTRIVFSDFTPKYNPIKDFISQYDNHPRQAIYDLWDCIDTPNKEILKRCGTKWYIGMIAQIFGGNSPLWLVFQGVQNNGKTRFFRNLLPNELRQFYAESKLDEGKDSDLLITQKLLIIDDEFGGKSKKEAKFLKQMSSKDVITVRPPYGRATIDIKRLSAFGGTTNEEDVINDPTGNRRIIPIEIRKFDFARLNAVNRIALFMWAVDQYKMGVEYELTHEDIRILNEGTQKFIESSVEGELLMKYFEPSEFGEELTASEIKVYIEDRTRQKLSLRKLGLELISQGFQYKFTSRGAVRGKYYLAKALLR